MKNCIYGYCRVSTTRQNLQRQIENVTNAYPNVVLFKEKWTGTKIDRPEWTKLYNLLKEGDTLVFDSVSRMSRDAKEGYDTYMDLFDKGINLVFLKEPHINSSVYRDKIEQTIQMTNTNVDIILESINAYLKLLAQDLIKIAFEQAEKEVNDLHDRISEGLRVAKANGSQIGQKKGNTYNTKKSIEAKEKIIKYSKTFDGTLIDSEVITLIGISKNTYYKYKKEILKNSLG